MIFQAELDIQVLDAQELGGMPYVDETEPTFEGNARLKAKALWKQAPENSWILADDSGLSVEAIGGAPGVYSSRYSGPSGTDEANVAKVLLDLELTGSSNRTAHFTCCFVLLQPEFGETIFQSRIKGSIATSPTGSDGFCYDPIFIPEGYDKTFAELGGKIKNTISHRAVATRELIEWLKKFQ